MRDKLAFQSKTVWGFLGFGVFGVLNTFIPAPYWTALIVTSLGWAGYGLRDAL